MILEISVLVDDRILNAGMWDMLIYLTLMICSYLMEVLRCLVFCFISLRDPADLSQPRIEAFCIKHSGKSYGNMNCICCRSVALVNALQ